MLNLLRIENICDSLLNNRKEEIILGKKTLRIALPQWQGGNNPTYFLGS